MRFTFGIAAGCLAGWLGARDGVDPQRFSTGRATTPASQTAAAHWDGAAQPGTNSLIKTIRPGLLQIGAVRLDQEKGAVSFPAAVNMREGPIEYIVVHSRGKIHESLLKTDAEPTHVHMAVLLLNSTRELATNLAMEVFIEWDDSGQLRRARAEDWVTDRQTEAALVPGTWIYQGSRLVEGVFLAQRDGSILAVIDDLDALAHNRSLRSQDDENWEARTGAIPDMGRAAVVSFVLGRKASGENAESGSGASGAPNKADRPQLFDEP